VGKPAASCGRNGVRTVTVRSFFQEGVYASNILKQARVKIAQIPLPPGYSIVYGGGKTSRRPT